MKRFIASGTALVLATAMLASCSAYKNPEKYITVPELSSITISQAKLDELLNEQIEEIRENNRVEDYKEVDDAAALGDQVSIDYTGRAADESVTLSEEALSGMKSTEPADLILGSGSFVGAYTDSDGNELTAGFEDQLIGHKASEEAFEITVTFPDDYSNSDELQGVKVIFTVTIHTVSRLTVDNSSLVSVDYTFTAPAEEDEENVEDEEDSDNETGDNTEASDTDLSAQSDEAEESDNSEDTSTSPDVSLDDDEEESKSFSDLFKDSDFEIDLSEEANDESFNDIFKIADFRDLFIGAHKYDEIEQKVTIPDDVADDYKDYAGKEITITFKVTSATVLPEWNDELVKDYTDETYTNTADYEAYLMKSIKSDQAYEAVSAAVTVNEYPKSETKKLYKQYVNNLLEQELGSSLDSLTASELKEKIDDATYESIYSSAATQSLAAVKERLIIEYLCNLLDITLSSKEYKEKLEETYQDYATNYMYYYYYYYGVMFADKDDLEAYYGKDSLELQFKTEKLLEILPDYLTVVD